MWGSILGFPHFGMVRSGERGRSSERPLTQDFSQVEGWFKEVGRAAWQSCSALARGSSFKIGGILPYDKAQCRSCPAFNAEAPRPGTPTTLPFLASEPSRRWHV